MLEQFNVGEISFETEEKTLAAADVISEAYYDALAVSTRDTTIILKRNMNELYINYCSPEWVQAWDESINIQMCIDFFAVASYITDSFTRNESDIMNILKEAPKSQHAKSMESKMLFLAQTFLVNRQMDGSEAIYGIIPQLHLLESSINHDNEKVNEGQETISFAPDESDDRDPGELPKKGRSKPSLSCSKSCIPEN